MLTITVDFSDGWIKTAKSEIKSGHVRFLEVSGMDTKNVSARELNRPFSGVFKSQPKNILSCISRQFVTVRFLKLPSVKEAEIEKMIEFQAARQLPVSIEDMSTGYRVLEKTQDGYSRVMLVMVQKNILSAHFDKLKAIGLVSDSVILSTEAILNLFLLSDVYKKQNLDSELYILLDVDYSLTELLICKGDNIFYTRAFAHGAAVLSRLNQKTEIDGWVKSLMAEVINSLSAFKKENTGFDRSINKIFMMGGVFNFFGRIDKIISEEFFAKIEYVDVFRDLKDPENAQVLSKPLSDNPLSFSCILGMNLAGQSLKIDLLPSDLKLKRSQALRQKDHIRLYVSLVFIFICIFLLFGARLYYKHSYIRYLGNQQSEIKPYVDRAQSITEKLNVIKGQVSEENSALEVLTEIYRLIGQGVKLSLFSFNEDKAVVLRGSSEAMPGIFDLAQKLENSKHFRNVKISFANKRKTQDSEFVDFQINCFLK